MEFLTKILGSLFGGGGGGTQPEQSSGGGGFMDMISNFIGMIANFFKSLFGFGDNSNAQGGGGTRAAPQPEETQQNPTLWNRIKSGTGKVFRSLRNTVSGTVESAVNFFQGKGWTKDQAAGIVANLHAESGLKTNAEGDGGQAYGVAQWHKDRQAEFKRVMGRDIQGSSLQDQLEFVHYELTQGNEQKAGRILSQTRGAKNAAHVVVAHYERPADIAGASNTRGALAERILASTGGSGTEVSSASTPLRTPAKRDDGDYIRNVIDNVRLNG